MRTSKNDLYEYRKQYYEICTEILRKNLKKNYLWKR